MPEEALNQRKLKGQLTQEKNLDLRGNQVNEN